MTDKQTYEAPEVVESFDEMDVLGETNGSPTLVTGSSTPINEI